MLKLKDKKCKHCRNLFTPSRPLQQACSISCAIGLENVRKDKAWKKRKKEGLEKLKTLSDFKSDLEEEINHIVRLIDKGHECISSGAKNYQVNAGHLYSVGAFPELRFNLLNIYNQSVHDNMHRAGNGVIYKERIKEVFGHEVSDEIEELKAKYPRLGITISEIKEAIKRAREAVRYLKKHTQDLEKPYSTEDRILLRRLYNGLIGIYKD
jgi:hypothetical protein